MSPESLSDVSPIHSRKPRRQSELFAQTVEFKHTPVNTLALLGVGVGLSQVVDPMLLARAMGIKQSRARSWALRASGLVLALVSSRALSGGFGRTRAPWSGNVHLTSSITVAKSPMEVYSYWRDFSNLPRFMAHLQTVTVEGEQSTWRARLPANMQLEWRAELTADMPAERIMWRTLEGSQLVSHGGVSFRPAPGNRGTEIHLSLTFEPPAGRLGRAFATLFRNYSNAHIQADLRRFKQLMETGEVTDAGNQPAEIQFGRSHGNAGHGASMQEGRAS
ncbi:MAG TPA: SRPBCC family protein [Polyangiaceae bacterium]|jgi:uncharacterized membrane protein|nr:SRPBCC family protein [Polyangiaceae bacterium]